MKTLTAPFGPGPASGNGHARIQKALLPQVAGLGRGEALPRVCLYTDSDVFAGTEAHILELALAMKRLGVPVRIAAPVPSALAQRAGVAGLRLLPIAKRGLVDVLAIRTLRGLLLDGQIDLVHAHNGRTALAAAAAVWSAGRGAALATQHFLEPNHTRQTGLKRQLSRVAHEWVAQHIHAHIAISHAVLESMLQRHETPAARISVVPNGISPIDKETLAAPEAVRRSLDVAEDSPLIVCAARLEPEKNIACLIRAMQKVVMHEPRAMCLVLGEGSLTEELARLIAAQGLAQRVRLLGFRADALAIMNAADLFVLPSLAEPFGLVLVEAMALGKPVVATNAGGPREIVEHEKSGLIVRPNDAEDLAEAIRRLMERPELRQQMAAAGYARFRNCFTADRMARSVLAIYQRAIRASRPSQTGAAG